MAKLNVPYTRRSNFSYAKAYKSYARRMKNCCNAVDGTFYNAINVDSLVKSRLLSPDSRRVLCRGE